MADYLLIESRDPFESPDSERYCALATDLARQGNQVVLFLIQNGVLPARAGARSQGLADAASAGVSVLADEFSLRERGIPSARVAPGVHPARLEVIVDALAEGIKVIWH